MLNTQPAAWAEKVSCKYVFIIEWKLYCEINKF